MGPTLTNSNYNAETYASYFSAPNSYLTGCTEEIERLRPKSPPPKSKSDRGGGGSQGRGGGEGLLRAVDASGTGPTSVGSEAASGGAAEVHTVAAFHPGNKASPSRPFVSRHGGTTAPSCTRRGPGGPASACGSGNGNGG